MRNRVLGIGLGLVVGIGLLVWQSNQLAVPEWDLLPENGGRIKTIAVQFSRDSAQDILPCYRSYFNGLADKVEVIAVCGNGEDADFFRRTVRSWDVPVGLKTVVVGKPITGWCRDRFLVGCSSVSTLICPSGLEPGPFTRTNDSLVGPTLARSYPGRFRTIKAPWRFDAGDILAMKSWVIVSDNLARKNGNPRDLEDQLQSLTRRRVIRLRGVPDHHIGMYVAPVDEYTVLVGDPKLGKQLWKSEFDRKFGKADFSTSATAPFERAASQLEAAGLKVIRVPLVYLEPQVYITYTNGVFEKVGSRKIAYIPWYGEPSLDEAARTVYKSAGFEVRPVNVGKLYRYRGTIGCLVNVLETE